MDRQLLAESIQGALRTAKCSTDLPGLALSVLVGRDEFDVTVVLALAPPVVRF